MTQTHSTATAAQVAQVSPRTIRRWAANGRVSATKVNGRWAIDADSLTAFAADRIADRADLTPYKDQAKARQAVIDLVETGSVIRLTDTVAQVLSKTDVNVFYIVDLTAQTCECKAHGRLGYCSHRTTANALAA